ncbi:MAG: sigma-54-dependent transcriptional regulator [Planctomycetota bacterium]|jgi:DNA-binding NtrC family response regulator
MYRTETLNGAARKVLLADEDSQLRDVFGYHLKEAGFEVAEADNGDRAMELLREDTSAVVVDLSLPGTSGMEVLKDVRARLPYCPVIVISGRGGIPDAVEAMRYGAVQFLAKPLRPEELINVVTQAVRASVLERDNRSLREAVRTPMTTPPLVARSKAMRNVRDQIERIASLESNVLITGASGTGKSTLARMIHQLGPRSDGPFISVSCASLPRDLIEAELFGHERGAFTGAVTGRPGRAEMAEGGTLFLDEIGDMPLELQPKLLTFLQEREVQRIGGKHPKKVDVRVIAATHHDLEQMVGEKRFREDLYFRLNVLRIETPSLAERREDLPELINNMLDRIGAQRRGVDFRLTRDAEQMLASHNWRGNLRELENMLERATAYSNNGTIDVDLFELDNGRRGAAHSSADRPYLAGFTMEEIERWALLDTLDSVGGNKAAAARKLGVCEKTIYNKLKRIRLQERHA